MKIELLSVERKEDSSLVEYCIDNGETRFKTVSDDDLTNFMLREKLNTFEDNDGKLHIYDPTNYLIVHKDEILKQYLQIL